MAASLNEYPTKVIKDYTLLVATGIHIKLYILSFTCRLSSLPSFIPLFIYIRLKKLIIFFECINKKIVQHNFRKIKVGAKCMHLHVYQSKFFKINDTEVKNFGKKKCSARDILLERISTGRSGRNLPRGTGSIHWDRA